MIGLVVPSINEEHISEVVSGVEDQLLEKNYSLLMAQSRGRVDREINVLKRMLDQRVDGLIVCPATRLTNYYEMFETIQGYNTPLVLIDRYPPVAPLLQVPLVVSDDRMGGMIATQHLLDQGHQRILFIAGPTGASSAEERFEGYRKAMTAAGCGNVDEFVFAAGFDIASGRTAALQALQEGVNFTAVFAVNDLVAIGVAEVLLKQGLRIPEDVSIVGYGDLKVGEVFKVPLTTVHQPKIELGQAAVKILCELIETKKSEMRRLPVQLIIRESTAPKGK